jgi:uncharacterized protein (TIGR03118 family)
MIMRIAGAAGSCAVGMFCALLLISCGGGGMGYGGAGPSMMPPAMVTVTVNPTSITQGQSATLAWSATSGTTCTASGAWSGAQNSTGTLTVTPTAAGSSVFTLNCSSGAYASGSASATLTVKGASAFTMTSLVADRSGATPVNVDPNLVNPWGLVIPTGLPAWTANNHTQTSTLYDGDGKAQPHAGPLVVTFSKSGAGVDFDPTGIVFNGVATDFVVTQGTVSGAAKFIFDGEGGMIAGWAPGVNTSAAINMYTDAGGAVYKGLTIAQNGGHAFLYAADFHNNKVDVFDSAFAKQATSATAFTFVDSTLPAGYAPFGIQAINNGTGGTTQIYVTYAQQQAPDNHDNANGAGLGYVDIYDTNGGFIKRLVTKGVLNAPWGIALAPKDFGTLSGALLVGNFGDGVINGYDAATGNFIGAIEDTNGAAIAVPGLWGIAFGNDANNQPHNTLFFAAGPNDEANGSYGRIDAGSTPPALNALPVVTLTPPSGNLSGTVPLGATVADPLKVATVDFLVGTTVVGTATTAPFSVMWDTTTVADGQVMVTAKATDVDGNVGSSAATTVTVANNGPVQMTLTQLQAQIFTPICSGCHNGIGTSLPGVQNLTNGHTFSSVVNVASLEQATLKRIKPNDPVNSYLIQKIEGAPGITGGRMPFGCGTVANPCLDQATIDMVKAWVSQGALNN